VTRGGIVASAAVLCSACRRARAVGQPGAVSTDGAGDYAVLLGMVSSWRGQTAPTRAGGARPGSRRRRRHVPVAGTRATGGGGGGAPRR